MVVNAPPLQRGRGLGDVKTRLEYIERDIGEINSSVSRLSESLEAQMQQITDLIVKKDRENEDKFVRNDLLKLQFNTFNENIANIFNLLKKSEERTDTLEKYEDMLKSIKQEREDIKNRILKWVQTGVFYVVALGAVIGIIEQLPFTKK